MISLARKRALTRVAQYQAETARTAAMIGRTGQVSRTTVQLGDEDVEVAGGVETAIDTLVTVDGHAVELVEAGDISDDVVDTLPDMTEDTWDAEDVGQIAADGADWAAEFATELETELDAAKVELEGALTEAHNALAEAGQARSEAAQAVADAQAAVAQASDAIQKALDAADLAEGAAPTWSTDVPSAGDASGKPVGAIWYVRDGAGKVTQMWELQPLGWFQRPFSETAIPQLAIGSGTYGSLAGDRLVAKSITAAQIQALAITANELAANSVTAVKLAADSVVAAKIQAGAVTTDKLNALAVTADKLAAGSVVADKIAAGAIVAGKLAATAIDGMTITGALFRTAPTGRRMEWTTSGIRSWNSSGVQTSVLSPQDGGFLVEGGFQIMSSSGANAITLATPDGVSIVENSTGTGASSRLQFGQVRVSAPADPNGTTGSVIVGAGGLAGGGILGVQIAPAPGTVSGSGRLSSGPQNNPDTNGSINLVASTGSLYLQAISSGERVFIGGDRIDLWADSVRFKSDTSWADMPSSWLASGWTLSAYTPRWRIKMGYVEFEGQVVNSSFTGGYTNAIALPNSLRNPGGVQVFSAVANTPLARSWRLLNGGVDVQAYSSATGGAFWPLNLIRYALT